MDEESQITSSPSILIPESPESPNLPHVSQNPRAWRENTNLETITQPNDSQEENAQLSDNLSSNNEGPVDDTTSETDNANNNIMWRPDVTYNDNASSGITDNFYTAPQGSQSNEDSNQSASTLPFVEPWRPGLGLFDDTSNSAQPQSTIISEDSRSTVVTMNEESNSSAACSESREVKDVIDEPPPKVRKLNSPKQNDGFDGETCPICLDSWGNSGEHRLVSLKCGHLFGAQCVTRWLKAQTNKDRSCPTCKSKATLKDIRFIYAKRLVAIDTSQMTSLQKQIDLLQAEKNRSELELQKSRIAHRACMLQLEVLRSTLLKSQVSREQSPRRSWRFALEKNLEICKDGGCRVLAYNCRTYEFYVSQKKMNNLFPGFGIRKVSCVDYQLGQFVYLHKKPIRDMTYSQPRDLLLSVGLDTTARIVDKGIPSASIQCGVPLWSCSWDYLRSNEIYVGGVGGVIHQYDIRNTGSLLHRLHVSGDFSPVVSLCSTEYGLLSCHLNSCWLWVSNLRQWEPRALPVNGPFMSMSYDSETHRALVSCRANGIERSRLAMCKLKSSVPNGDVVIDIEQSFAGSTQSYFMSKSTWVRVPGASWAAAHSESDSSLYLHGLDGARTISLPAAEPALDVCAAQLNGDTVLAALSESKLRLYKAVSTNF